MKHRQCRRSPAILHRMRKAAALAWRSTQPNADAAMGNVPAIEDQLKTLKPVCSAQRVSTGIACGAPAVAVAEIHPIDGCEQQGLSPSGDLIEILCQSCLTALQGAMATYVGDKRETASRSGTRPSCSTCGRLTQYLPSVFTVRPIGSNGLTL